jgi:putative permease
MKQVLKKWFEQYLGSEEAVLLGIILIVSFIVLATLGSVLGPFIAAIIIAFLLQGLVNNLQRFGLSQLTSVLGTYIVFLLAFISTFVVIIPIIVRQTSLLLRELPDMVTQLRELLTSFPEKLSAYIGPEQLQLIIVRLSEEAANVAEQLLSFSISTFPNLFGVMIYIVLVPLLVFFMLKDKDQLLLMVSDMLPRERKVMTTIWSEMNMQFANYVRGKAIEIGIVGAVSFLAFLILGLQYAALLALLIGLSVLIPYVGATVVTVPVLLVGYFQWGFSSEFVWLVVVYGVIQILDGNVLVPLLFSEVVNLHPVAIIVAVLLFGGIWGFWGLFFAIPLATLVKAVYNAWPRNAQS